VPVQQPSGDNNFTLRLQNRTDKPVDLIRMSWHDERPN
jgi:hypothetical protein